MKERNSNFELLRIIAMMFIVIFHISGQAQKCELETHNYVTSITSTGVNLFLLISGYFGINLKWKNLLNTLNIIIFYYVVSLIATYITFNKLPTFGEIINIFTPISRNPWWFMKCYIVLMLISPALNIITQKASETQYKQIVITLTALTVISGYIFSNQYVNHNGFTLFQFINIYFIGNAISRYKFAEKLTKRHWLIIYIISTITLFFIYNDIDKSIRYNNPFLIIAAISLFCFIARLKIKSKMVNTVATFMLPIYLLQESPFGFKIYSHLYELGKTMFFTGIEYWMTICIYIITLIATALVFEGIRRVCFCNIIDKLSTRLRIKANIFNE